MSFSFLEETALQYWEQLACPVSLKCAILTRYGHQDEVLTITVNPDDYLDTDPESLARACAAVAFVKKNPYWGSSNAASRRKRCLDSWFGGEASCLATNQRIAEVSLSPDAPYGSLSVPGQFLFRAKELLRRWLGHGPTDSTIHRLARHGPGTTFASSVKKPTAADKFSEIPTMTRNAVWYVTSLVGTIWGENIASRYRTSFRDCIQTTRGNRFTTVPKTALTDRGITIEASINVWFQLAVGTALRRSLSRSTGWDLDHAASTHRHMARRASIDGSFATLDLSNASDSLAKGLVRYLFAGTSWLERMDDLRSTHTFVDGKWHYLEKFSGMGNGYTFELETVIFAALAGSMMLHSGIEPILGHNLFVFGDDIIVPSDVADLVTRGLKYAGFELNRSKSFTSGSFRESCGADYFRGHPVRGFYLKTNVTKNSQPIYTVHNGARVVLQNCGINSPWFCDWILSRFLDAHLRQYGGSSRLGDAVLHGRRPRFKHKNGIRWVKGVRWGSAKVVPWRYFSDATRLACSLVGVGRDPRGILSRGVVPGYEVVWLSDS